MAKPDYAAPCEWDGPEGCDRGALRLVVTHEGDELRLCLHHAGTEWNRRRAANRAAGKCPCGADRTPGFKTCARCRAVARAGRRCQRHVSRLARLFGIELPRSRRRREAFVEAATKAVRDAEADARSMWTRIEADPKARVGGVRTARTATWEGVKLQCTARAGPDGVRLDVSARPSP